MRTPFRIRLGLWLERFAILEPVLLRFGGVGVDGRRWYVNRVSRTLAPR